MERAEGAGDTFVIWSVCAGTQLYLLSARVRLTAKIVTPSYPLCSEVAYGLSVEANQYDGIIVATDGSLKDGAIAFVSMAGRLLTRRCVRFYVVEPVPTRN